MILEMSENGGRKNPELIQWIGSGSGNRNHT